MMKQNWMHARRTMAAILALGALATAGTAAALEYRPAQPVRTAAQAAPAGTLVLSAGAAEIEVRYDAQGRVSAVTGRTEAGRRIVAEELRDDALTGRTARKAVYEMVDALGDAGYLARENDLIVRAAHGSVYPTETFFREIEQAAHAAILEDRREAQTTMIGRTDYDEIYGDRGYLDEAAARRLLEAQLDRTDLKFLEKTYDLEDGVYELAFLLDGVVYEYEISASTGKILETEAETPDRDDRYDDDDDDWDDRYDDDDDDDWDDRYDD